VSYEIRQMSFGEILDTGFRLLRDHFLLLGVPAALPSIPIAVLLGPLIAGSLVEPPQDPSFLAAAIGALVFALLLYPVVMAAITHAVGELYVGRSVNIQSALGTGVSLFLPVVGTHVLGTLAVTGALVLVGLPVVVLVSLATLLGLPRVPLMLLGILWTAGWMTYLWLAWLFLVTPVVVLEGVSGARALKRAYTVVRGHMLRGFGVFMVGGILMSTLSTGVQYGLGWVPGLGLVASGLAQAAGFAYTTALVVLFYFDIRCRKEAFDLEHLARQVEAQTVETGISGT
jgi:hypothetical protein